LKWLPEAGYDASKFDTKSIAAWNAPCRALIRCGELYEYSLVSVPMNPKALATEAKFYVPSAYWWDDDTDENTAAVATVAALNALYSELCEDVADALFSMATPDEIATALQPEFEMFATQSIALIRAIMTILAGDDEAMKSRVVELVRRGARGMQVRPTSPDTDTSKTRGGDVQKTLSQTLSTLAATAAIFTERAS
jgi:hypothetical protein